MPTNPPESSPESPVGVFDYRPCANCAGPVPTTDFHPDRRYCSRRCQMAAYHRAAGHIPMGTTVTGTCDGCGCRFTYQMRKRPRKWCPACRPTSHRAGPAADLKGTA
jgi:hypothetical protein